ncbi:hypothetical protein A3F55_02750 [Candidatus Adlerbacteria bacterium RIFCSPHIGHO2_12_FULL_53_18]|uniref:Type II secretion system protein GspG C-terminal domain-containing protein n=2 Tax=Parcubacteria group TaxID=1794811 RepID=A0A1F4XSN5_9BACT|nr:MAG: hypothetical protein A3F55_02750 [Candidatus Adlerbacteria bacterium RIFCSPHIGHO2_12_FULL_53_18]OGG49102.1 MAG: hypothetical protein A2704_00400 [Candidatus Kaiserbacteria bacterium RIFCSPHIGHO2_01_FULL_54_36b]
MHVRGFTLVELMVVVGIIGILSTIVVAGLGSSRKESRDAKRYSDLINVDIGLKLYYNDNGSYPSTGGSWWTVCTNGADPTPRDTSGANGYVPNLAPAYIAVLPTDPSGCVSGGSFKGYIYRSNGTNYKLSTDWSAEVGTKCKLGQNFADPRRTTESQHTFCSVYSQGAADW